MGYRVADGLCAREPDSRCPTAELGVDGGAAVNNLLMQIQADLTGVPVVRPRVQETTALGAAYLAGLARGVWKGTDEISDRWQVDRTFEPVLDSGSAAERRARWSRAVG